MIGVVCYNWGARTHARTHTYADSHDWCAAQSAGARRGLSRSPELTDGLAAVAAESKREREAWVCGRAVGDRLRPAAIGARQGQGRVGGAAGPMAAGAQPPSPPPQPP